METTEKTISKNAMIESAITNLGQFNKLTRKANVQAILDCRSKVSGLSLNGSLLKVDVTLGFKAPENIHNSLREVMAGHEVSIEKSTVGLGKTYIVIDLLKMR